ncbi:MAG: peptide chain release factor N(5)-glutamine methyltransferase [Cypionkella sp.]|nr:peptide chain release factor N(5)-glutamine methyltransferase [Cypionkella sp.]
MTPLAALLPRAVAELRAGGVEEAARDARLLLAHAAGVAADRLTLHLQDPASEAVSARFAALVTRRAAREPLSHLIGWRLFWGRAFAVSSAVLDPRPETELLVATALAEPFTRVLDLGTGSGAILISLLADRPAATGVGVDLSPAALAVARKNAEALGVAERSTWVESDWFAGVEGRFDLIVSNPPYIAAEEMAGLSPEVRLHEPRLALTDGADGLSAYRAIVAGAGAHLAPGGRLMVEIGPTQGQAVAALFARAGLQAIRILPDFDGRDRVVAACR